MAGADKPWIAQQWDALVGSADWLLEWLGVPQRFAQPVAAVFLALVAIVLLWWLAPKIAQRPFVAGFLTWLRRKPIRRARPDRLTVAVARLQHDTNGEHEKLLLDELSRGFDGADTKALGRMIAPPDPGTVQEQDVKGTAEAQRLLRRARADVLVWGEVVRLGGRSAMRLFWTTDRALAGAKPHDRYDMSADTIALPPLFWDDLRQVLGLLVQSRLAALADELNGRFAAARLAPLIGQVRKLLQARQGSWPAETEAGMRFAFAWALLTYGEQAGDSAALAESAASCRLVLPAWTRDRVPLDWATTQNNLGNALERLGERESDTELLQAAVDAFRLALQEWTRDRVPLDWATTQNNLSAALAEIANRRHDATIMDTALAAARGAAEVFRAGGATHYLSVAEANIRRMEVERTGMAAGQP